MERRTTFRILLFQLCILLSIPLMIAQQDIVTDRPDQTESALAVGHGVLQIETGILLERITYDFPGDPQDKIDQFGTTLIRLGLGNQFELRAASSYQSAEYFGNEETLRGMGPLTLGMKIELFSMEGWIPDAAFLLDLTLPGVGKEEFRPEYVAPAFRFSFGHDLSDRFSLGYNLGMEWDGVQAASSGLYTLALGADIGLGFGTYAELFGFLPEGGEGTHFFDGGITYLLFPDLQFDLSGGFGLNDAVSNYSYLSLGISLRMPNLF